jgi:prepilin-type N-terminal cleavage/methylation domain-containing protein
MIKINSQKGFTLIELMVVVSIIALLSSIVIVGLNDARSGAKNSKRNETARQYITALGIYHNEYGNYPEQTPGSENNTTNVCLGNGYPNASCYVIGSHDQNTNVNNQISEFIPGIPASLEKTVSGTTEFYGISYKCLEAECLNYSISWVLEGSGSNASCFGGASELVLNSRIKICTYSTI